MNFMTLRLSVMAIVSVAEDLDPEDPEAVKAERDWQVKEFTSKTGLIVETAELVEND